VATNQNVGSYRRLPGIWGFLGIAGVPDLGSCPNCNDTGTQDSADLEIGQDSPAMPKIHDAMGFRDTVLIGLNSLPGGRVKAVISPMIVG
jgi:hypothetical protein